MVASAGRASRPAIAALAAWLAGAALASCAPQDGSGSGMLAAAEMRTAEALEARRTLEGFLDAMAAGRFADAAEAYSGDTRKLQDLSWAVAPDDVTELLEHYCRRHGGACLPHRLVDGHAGGGGRFDFTVEFLGEGGRPVAFGDTLLPHATTSRVVLRVQRIGTRFYVLDLPPRRS